LALFSAQPVGHLEPIPAHTGPYRPVDVIVANLKSLFQDRLDKLSQVTGQPLTAQQQKDVKDNSRMPRAWIVLSIIGTAAVVGSVSYGLYRVSHPPAMPTLPPPTLPPGFGTIP